MTPSDRHSSKLRAGLAPAACRHKNALGAKGGFGLPRGGGQFGSRKTFASQDPARLSTDGNGPAIQLASQHALPKRLSDRDSSQNRVSVPVPSGIRSDRSVPPMKAAIWTRAANWPAAYLAILWLISSVAQARGDDFSQESRFFRQLAAPMTSILDGKPFRDSLQSIAAAANLNLWLDREVDPSVLVEVGPLGPTVFAAIEKLSASQGCAVMPIANVVLVGREAWLLRTAAIILSLPPRNLGDSIDVRWDDLTTPNEAWRRVAGDAAGENASLPHDLWPAVEWKAIKRQVAAALIAAQLDVRGNDAISPPQQPRAFTRRYSVGIAPLAEIRDAMRKTDASAQVRVSGGWMIAKGTIKAHHAATIAMFAEVRDLPGPDPDADTFTLKKMTTSAENALRQLTRTAGKTCIIKPDAVDACRAIISVEGTDVTLRQLIDMVAKQAGVLVKWQDDTIEVSLAP